MGRKKGSGGSTQQAAQPFCYFCDRSFADETVLLQHQRAKHFRCPECDDGAIRGKCESVQGLIIHTLKVHSRNLTRVPNALQGRDNPGLDVYGMDGVPDDVLRMKGHEPKGEPASSKDPAPPPQPPPQQPPPAGFPGYPGYPSLLLPGMAPPGAPPVPGFLGMPPPGTAPAPGAPSLEGFAQFLAAAKGGAPPPLGAPPGAPGVPPGGMPPLPGAPLPPPSGGAVPPPPGGLLPPPGWLPPPGMPPPGGMPPPAGGLPPMPRGGLLPPPGGAAVPPPAGGFAPPGAGQFSGQKRPLEQTDGGEDVSKMPRYQAVS